MRTIRYIVEPQEDGRRVGSYLRGVAGISNRLLVDLKKTDYGIRCNGVHVRVIDRVHAGDELCITIDDHPKEYLATPIEVPILFEDEDLLVYNKPAGMASHQSRRNQTDSLGNAFAWHCQQMGLAISFRPVNRLDQGHLWHCVGGQEPACCLPTERRGGEGVFRRGLRPDGGGPGHGGGPYPADQRGLHQADGLPRWAVCQNRVGKSSPAGRGIPCSG